MKKMKDMPYHFGLRMRLYPSRRQKNIIKLNSDAARFVYNRCVAIGNELYQLKKTKIYLEPIARRIHFLRTEYCNPKQMSTLAPFLNHPDIDALAKANAVQNYRAAWTQFHSVPGTRIPTFHKKSYSETYQTNAQYQQNKHGVIDGAGVRILDETHIILPKIGRVRMKGNTKFVRELLTRKCDTRIGTATVTKEPNEEYYISMQLGSDCPFIKKLQKTGTSVGIDVNLENFCADSEGNIVPNPHWKRTMQRKLSKAQRKLSRREKRAKKEKRNLLHAKNYQKQRRKVAALHNQAANQRRGFLHNLSTQYIKNHDIIGIENLKIKNLLKKRRLAYSISDAAWGMFRRFLEYKGTLYDKKVIAVPPEFTTQTCSVCQYVLQPQERLTLRDRDWICPCCHTKHLRDNNAAAVIRQRAVSVLAIS